MKTTLTVIGFAVLAMGLLWACQVLEFSPGPPRAS